MDHDDLESLVSKTTNKSGWKITPKLHGDPKYAAYVKSMAQEIAKHPKRAKPIRPEGMSEQDFILSLQSSSTKEIIKLQADPNYKRDWTAPLPDNVQVLKEDGSIDIGEREISAEEKSLVESTRRAKKNTLGQSEWTTLEQTKDNAIEAFMDTKAEITDLEKFHLKRGSIDTNPYETWKELTPWQAVKHFFKGKKVRRD